MATSYGEQLTFPVYVPEEVSWYIVEEKMVRKRLFGKKAIHQLVMADWLQPATSSIDPREINEDTIHDRELRYHLRFAAAAEAIGWTRADVYSQSFLGVSINATDEGPDSRFVHAQYDGHPGDFEELLHSFDPRLNENH